MSHILVTNDDGVLAPGLLSLTKEMRKIAKVSILAPDRNWSGSGHVKTLDRPLRVREVTLADGTAAFASDGAPSDCVALALLGFLEEKVDLVVSGINPQANIGHDVTYSGTVTAAMEAVIWDVPAIAFSLDSADNHLGSVDYRPAAQVARRIAATVLNHGLPPGILLNVNIPYMAGPKIHGVHITRQGLRVYRDRLDKRMDPRGRPYYWIAGEAPTGIPERGTDFGALESGHVSITPLQMDLTMYPIIPAMADWDWSGRSDEPRRENTEPNGTST
jgi:5'-nucleotidase